MEDIKRLPHHHPEHGPLCCKCGEELRYSKTKYEYVWNDCLRCDAVDEFAKKWEEENNKPKWSSEESKRQWVNRLRSILNK